MNIYRPKSSSKTNKIPVTRELAHINQEIMKHPGPGDYDLNFKDELKLLDQKLSARYKQVPFGMTSSRFELEEYNSKAQNKV